VTGGGHALNGLFEAGTAYTATVTLTAASGYTFDGVGANAFICNGVTTLSNSAGSGVVSIVFPATEPNQTTVIPSVDLTSVLLAPIAFVPTVTVINTGTYRGTVVWTTSAGNGPVQAFETGTVYRATVTLYPAAGYSFPAALPVTHSGSSGGIAAFTGEPRQGTITFPVTGTFSNFSGPFSGSSLNPADSAIDLIQAAKAAEHPFLYLQLGPRAAETVNISASDQDIGTSTDGLVLNTTTSPPGVTIDGGKRTIELAQAGTLITVGAGVTLTLRNITIIGASGNTAPLVNEVDGGRVIYETGVSTFNKTTLQTSSSLSNSKTKGGSGIDLIRAAYDSAPNDLLTVTLEPGTEVVSLDDTADIGTGLVLNSGNSPTQVTIDGSGRTIQLDGNTSGSIITVGAGVTLTLQNITFKGKAGNNAPLIKVNGGTLILGEGAELTDSSLYGVELDGGAFMMTGGSVSNSASTGVRVITGAFSMSGGSVSDNANNGVSLGTAGSTFSMSGGSVSRNKNYGVLVGPGAGFFMTGGTISGNTGAAAGGVVLNQGGGTFTKTGGTIYGGNEAGTDAGGPLANTALWGTGHAVGGEKTRSTTAGPGDYLDSTKTGTEGGWE
jgi:hypothetical protein